MKQTGSNKVLGLAIGERSILAAEVWSQAGGRPEARRLAEFPYPEGLSLQQPEALGKALAGFLRRERFSARSAVVGLPAKWVMAKPKDVPAADEQTTADLLRLQVEREFPPELKEMVADFAADPARAGRPKNDGTDAEMGRVLLMATPRTHVDGPVALARAARLTLLALTPTSAALAAATRRAQPADRLKDDLVLYLAPAAAELTVQAGAAPTLMRHLRLETRPPAVLAATPAAIGTKSAGNGADNGAPHADPNGTNGASAATAGGGSGRVSVAMLSGFLGELRRAVALMPRNGSAGGRELVVWDGVGLDEAGYRALGDSTGLPVRSEGLSALGLDSAGAIAPDDGDGRRFAGAAALALAGFGESPARNLPVDFLHSRLAPRQRASHRRAILWGAVALVCVVGGSLWAYSDLTAREQEWATLKARVDSAAPALKEAEARVAKISTAQRWYGTHPRFLDGLKDITNGFPDDGGIIATNFSLHDAAGQGSREAVGANGKSAARDESLRCTISGKSSELTGKYVNALTGKLRANPHCQNVTLGGMNAAGKELTFTISFSYVP